MTTTTPRKQRLKEPTRTAAVTARVGNCAATGSAAVETRKGRRRRKRKRRCIGEDSGGVDVDAAKPAN